MARPRLPPRFVPTLVEVIEAGPDLVPRLPAPSGLAEPSRAAAIGPLSSDGAEMDELDELVVQRVLERVDRLLEDRVSDAVASVVQAQLDAMIPVLRSEIEGVVRALVAQSVAAELSENQGSAPFSPP